MKISKHLMMRLLLSVVIFSVGLGEAPLRGSIFDKVKKTAKKATKDVKKGAKKAKKGVEKSAKKAKKGVEKGIKEVEKISKDALKQITNLGIPTDPQKLLEFAFTKMPTKDLEKLAEKIIKIISDQFSDVSKLLGPVLTPIDEIFRPIPPLPKGLPIPIPIVGSLIDIVLGLTQSTEISRSRKEMFANLKAFHVVTNNKYITKEEADLIKAREEFEAGKGVIGQIVDLKKARELETVIKNEMQKLAKPIQQVSDFLLKSAAPLLQPFEQIASNFRPNPLACIIPLGPIYNTLIFSFRLRENSDLLASARFAFENNLNPRVKEKSALTSILDLKKNPITANAMKLLETMANPVNKELERIDEMFVDPLAKLPWGAHTAILMLLKVGNLAGGVIDTIMGVVIEAVVTAVTGGAGAAVSGPVSTLIKSVINVDVICELVSETFTWSYIRYLKKMADRLNDLVAKARADGVAFDSSAFKKERQKILDFKEDYQVKDKGSQGKSKKEKNKKGKKDKKDKKGKKDKKDKKTFAQAPSISTIPAVSSAGIPASLPVFGAAYQPQVQMPVQTISQVPTPMPVQPVYQQPMQPAAATTPSAEVESEEPDFDDTTGVEFDEDEGWEFDEDFDSFGFDV